jgi:hypothetical protein
MLKPIYHRMNKHTRTAIAAGVLATTAAISAGETVSPQADPPDANCPENAPCSILWRIGLPPDGSATPTDSTSVRSTLMVRTTSQTAGTFAIATRLDGGFVIG